VSTVDIEPPSGEQEALASRSADTDLSQQAPKGAEVVTGPSPSRVARSTASVLNRLPVGRPARRAGHWLRRRVTPAWVVAGLASALSIASYVWYAQRGLTLAYADAISHLMIARRVVAGTHPGLAQLGNVWLPLHHLLMLPLIWNDALFRSGFAGAFPAMVAYVVSAIYLYRSGSLLFASRSAGLMAALCLMLNPSVLYMQSTPMSELDLICASVVAVYYAARWARAHHTADLVKCAAATAAGTLVRYDAWALAVVVATLIGYIAWSRWGRRGAEAHLLLFGTLAFAGCAAWIVYQQVIFGSGLPFLNGSYSAQAEFQRDIVQPLTYHNPLLSLHVYSQAVADTFWWPIVVVAGLGLVWWMVRVRLQHRSMPLYAALVPFGFNCLSMVLGITSLWTGEISVNGVRTFFNGRFALGMVPAIALFLAYVAIQRRALLVVVFGVVVVFGGVGTLHDTPYALQDPLHGANAQLQSQLHTEARWLTAHYHGGKILISYSPFAPAIFESGLPEKDFVVDGDGARFQEALADPDDSITWIVMAAHSATFDPVWAALSPRQDWRHDYALRQVFNTVQGNVQFYKRSGST
jgi:hypothetical protein